MEALLGLGCREEAEAFFWWLMHASQNTRPRLQVLYRLDGGARAKERTLRLDGYSGSRPVRLGNKAIEQRQLDIYGDLMQTAWLYADAGYKVDREIADRLAAIADLVCEIWSEPDAGIWEVRSEFEHFTQSKMLCWVALDRAMRLAADGHIPPNRVERWAAAASDVRAFVEERCWSAKKPATPGRRGAKSWTQASCWELGWGTSPRMISDWHARSMRLDASSRTLPSSIGTSARTDSAAAKAPSSAAHSGWWKRSRRRAGSMRRPC